MLLESKRPPTRWPRLSLSEELMLSVPAERAEGHFDLLQEKKKESGFPHESLAFPPSDDAAHYEVSF